MEMRSKECVGWREGLGEGKILKISGFGGRLKSILILSSCRPLQIPLQTMRINTLCHLVIDFSTETPICNNGCVQIHRDGRVHFRNSGVKG